MFRQKLCLSLMKSLKTPTIELPALYKTIGFDAFFPSYESKAQMLALSDEALSDKLLAYKKKMAEKVVSYTETITARRGK